MTKGKMTQEQIKKAAERMNSMFSSGSIKQREAQNSIVRFRWLEYPNSEPNVSSGEGAFMWQGFHELNEDHGLGEAFEVLRNASLCSYQLQKPTELIASEIKSKVGEEGWPRIERHYLKFGGQNDSDGHGRIFLVALWAELFTESYGEVWLAAMAQYAHYVLEDDYAFGYFTALLDQKRNNETDFLRGQKGLASAKEGGQVRARETRKETEKTLRAMEPHVAGGKSIARAASLAHRSGRGSSADANVKLWRRNRKK